MMSIKFDTNFYIAIVLKEFEKTAFKSLQSFQKKISTIFYFFVASNNKSDENLTIKKIF